MTVVVAMVAVVVVVVKRIGGFSGANQCSVPVGEYSECMVGNKYKHTKRTCL